MQTTYSKPAAQTYLSVKLVIPQSLQQVTGLMYPQIFLYMNLSASILSDLLISAFFCWFLNRRRTGLARCVSLLAARSESSLIIVNLVPTTSSTISWLIVSPSASS